MSLIINGVEIPTNGNVTFDGHNIEKVICDGVTVWEKIVFTFKDFFYTGGVQPWQVPASGVYKLEVWGAGGGQSGSQTGSPVGGQGGYSIGYKYLTAGTIIFVVVGGKGEMCPDPIEVDDGNWGIEYIDQNINGGYNGGGGASSYKSGENNWIHCGGTGGGATHIATTNRGELKNYENFKSEVLIVAGGGGGGRIQLDRNEGWIVTGGSGGGLEGGVPNLDMYDPGTDEDGWTDPDATWDLNGDLYKSTQTSGYKFGEGCSEYSGGGGGWYGGRCERKGCFGGSGYIGGCEAFIVLNGVKLDSVTQIGGNEIATDGKCRVTYVTSSL